MCIGGPYASNYPTGTRCLVDRIPLQPTFFGKRDQKRSEKAKPAKKVDAARALCPVRRLRIADAVTQNMIITINAMIKLRRRSGVNMQ